MTIIDHRLSIKDTKVCTENTLWFTAFQNQCSQYHEITNSFQVNRTMTAGMTKTLKHVPDIRSDDIKFQTDRNKSQIPETKFCLVPCHLHLDQPSTVSRTSSFNLNISEWQELPISFQCLAPLKAFPQLMMLIFLHCIDLSLNHLPWGGYWVCAFHSNSIHIAIIETLESCVGFGEGEVFLVSSQIGHAINILSHAKEMRYPVKPPMPTHWQHFTTLYFRESKFTWMCNFL